MPRLSSTQYDRRVFVAMMIYMVLLFALLPYARGTGELWLRATCSLLPTLPMFYVVWLMGRRIWQSDELEQRTHLIGLGAASAAVGVFTLIGGFLAITKVVPGEAAAALLIWVFPVLMASYGLARWWVARRYGGSGCDEDGIPMHRRFVSLATIFVLLAAWAYFHSGDDFAVGVFCGFSAVFALAAVIYAVRRSRRRAQASE